MQQIASCFWRYRRLLQFENRAAFAARDRRAYALMNPTMAGAIKFQPLYVMDGKLSEADEIFRQAGMNRMDLPDEYDSNRVVRYEATISRTMHRAMAKLEASRKARIAAAKETGGIETTEPAREVVLDVKAQERDRQGSAQMMAPYTALRIASTMREGARKKREKKAAKAAAKEAAGQAEKPADAAASNSNAGDQTKPNSPAYPHTQRDQGILLKAIDDLARIGNPPGSKRPPSN